MNIGTEKIIISLGGSLIHPKDGININFIKQFSTFIRNQIQKRRQFFIICGGGYITREYQQAVSKVIPNISSEDLDWLGIHVTKLNAQLMRSVFHDVAYPKIIFKYDQIEPKIVQPVVIAAGWKPGWSTDYDAVILARDYGAKSIINLSNIEVVYDKDPNKFDDAKPIEKISWDDFEKLVGDKWSPGANLPFDPIATKLAKKLNLNVYITQGLNIKNITKILNGKPFKGTIISSFKIDNNFYNKQYYELGIGYKGYTTTMRGRLLAHVASMYRALMIKLFFNPKKLLDVGCGTGLLIYYLRKLGVNAEGIEISHYALSKAHPSVKTHLRYASVLDLPYANSSFDLVTSFNVLEHLNENQLSVALSECDRVTASCALHKVYTQENGWMRKFYSTDISKISIFPKKWWDNFFNQHGYKRCKKLFLILPQFMETIFLLDKKTKNSTSTKSKTK